MNQQFYQKKNSENLLSQDSIQQTLDILDGCTSDPFQIPKFANAEKFAQALDFLLNQVSVQREEVPIIIHSPPMICLFNLTQGSNFPSREFLFPWRCVGKGSFDKTPSLTECLARVLCSFVTQFTSVLQERESCPVVCSQEWLTNN